MRIQRLWQEGFLRAEKAGASVMQLPPFPTQFKECSAVVCYRHEAMSREQFYRGSQLQHSLK